MKFPFDDVMESAIAERKWLSKTQSQFRVDSSIDQSFISSLTGDEIERKNPLLLELSEITREILAYKSMLWIRRFIILITFLCLCYNVTVLSNNHMSVNDGNESSFVVLNLIVDGYYIGEGFLRLITSYGLPNMTMISLRHVIGRIRAYGVVDMLLSILIISFSTSDSDSVKVTNWLRLFRITLLSIYWTAETIKILVLMNYIRDGLSAVASSLKLLLASCFFFASVGVLSFRENDPLHFGTLPTALWTSFSMATLDTWSEVMYINFHGCDNAPSVYQMDGNGETDAFILRYGKMMLPVCSDPHARPVLAVIVCVSFVLVCGFVLYHTVIAGMACGFSNSIATFSYNVGAARPRGGANKKALLSNPRLLAALIHQVWRDMDFQYENIHIKRSRYYVVAPIDSQSSENMNKFRYVDQMCANWPRWRGWDDVHLSVFSRALTNHIFYRAMFGLLVVISIVLEAYSIEHDNSDLKSVKDVILALDTVQTILQFVFSIHLFFRFWAAFPETKQSFVSHPLNFLEVCVLLVTWVEVFSFWGGATLRSLGVCRISRLALLLSFSDTASRALAKSWKSLSTIFVLWSLFVFLAAVAGVLLFEENDPFHFGSLLRGVMTIVQISSLDGWAGVAYTNMLGCDHYGYSSGVDDHDTLCDTPDGKGWFAAAYFLFVVLVSVVFLFSLIIAILILSTSNIMDTDNSLKRELEEREVLAQQHDHRISDTAVKICRDFYSLLVDEDYGLVTVDRVAAMFNKSNVSHDEASLLSCFTLADKNMMQELDFPGFLYFMYLAGQHLSPESSGYLKSNSILKPSAKISPSKGVHVNVAARRALNMHVSFDEESISETGGGEGGKPKRTKDRRSNSMVALDRAWANKDRFSLQNVKKQFHNAELDVNVEVIPAANREVSEKEPEREMIPIRRNSADGLISASSIDLSEKSVQSGDNSDKSVQSVNSASIKSVKSVGSGGANRVVPFDSQSLNSGSKDDHDNKVVIDKVIGTSGDTVKSSQSNDVDSDSGNGEEEKDSTENNRGLRLDSGEGLDQRSDNSKIFDGSYHSSEGELCPPNQGSLSGSTLHKLLPSHLSPISRNSQCPSSDSSFCSGDVPIRTPNTTRHLNMKQIPDPSRMHEEEAGFLRPHVVPLISKSPVASPGGTRAKYIMSPSDVSLGHEIVKDVFPGDIVEALKSMDEPIFVPAEVLSRHDPPPPTSDDSIKTASFTLRYASGDISGRVSRVGIRFAGERQRGKLKVGEHVLASCKSMNGTLMPGVITATHYPTASYSVYFDLFDLVGKESEDDTRDDFCFEESVRRDAMCGIHYTIRQSEQRDVALK